MSTLEEARRIAKAVLYEMMPEMGHTTDKTTGKQLMRFWMPLKLKELLIAEHYRPDTEKSNIAVIKYFNPSGIGTWWISEYDPEYAVFFGKAELFCKELGTVSYKELRETQTPPFNLYIERDYYFEPKPLKEC